MKKILLFVIIIFGALLLNAQVTICTTPCPVDETCVARPEAIIPMCPESDEIPHPMVGCYYELCITVMMPEKINKPPLLNNVSYSKIEFTGFTGIPEGFDYCVSANPLFPNNKYTLFFSGTPTTPGTYELKLNAKVYVGNMPIPINNESANVIITVDPATAPVASFTSDTTIVIERGTVRFTNTSTLCPSSYSWTFEGGTPNTSTEENPVVVYNTSGTYDVTLSAINSAGQGTELKSNYITVTPNTSNIISDKNNIKVYPNPASSQIVVEAQNIEKITVIDITGKVILSIDKKSDKEVIDISHLKKANYLLKIKTADLETIKPITIK